MGDLPVALRPLASYATSSAEVNPLETVTENWATADGVAGEIIRKVQPSSVSEEKRREVVDYIQRLIKNFLGAEVFLYGSVPLKTYLPEGDLDFTAFGGPNFEDTFVYEMRNILEDEERNMAAPFMVKDVQLIEAEVKLVKCIVQGIVIDVSFNQIGGLSTLCFLEQVDRIIGKDHLFKRSIILIKAWCFYESRILGAHHGLISTYALETLVLYIFHLFHSTLVGPLAVLYKFLDYFSKFDWDTYCISLNGPVRLSSLPALIAELPEDSEGDLLLSNDFLSTCAGKFSVPSGSASRNSRGFQRKHLNIVDPLREANNLGRSVSKGNFYRIRSAFSYGARKLEQIFLQPEDSIRYELYRFFSNTLARCEGGQRADVQGFDFDESAVANGHSQSNNSSSVDLLDRSPSPRFIGGSNNLVTSGLADLKISSDSSAIQNESVVANPKPLFAPHLNFSHLKSTGDSNSPCSDNGDKHENNASSLVSSGSDDERGAPSESCNGTELVDKDLSESFDLTGDYESYMQYLQYGRWCYECSLGMQSIRMPPFPAAPYQNLPPSHFKQNGFSHQHHNGFHPSIPLFSVQPVTFPGVPFRREEHPKPRGTGTYFPDMEQPPQGYRPSSMKGPSRGSPRSNGSSTPHMNGNSFPVPPEEVLEFELAGASMSATNRLQRSVSSSSRSLSGIRRSQKRDEDRIALRSSYHLRDEDDFPPLSV